MLKRSIRSCSFVLLVDVGAGEGASNSTNALLLPLEEAASSVEPVPALCEFAPCVFECLQYDHVIQTDLNIKSKRLDNGYI